METNTTKMEKNKNKPPAGYLIALAIIVGLIIFYFILSAIFPELFESLSQGEKVAQVVNGIY